MGRRRAILERRRRVKKRTKDKEAGEGGKRQWNRREMRWSGGKDE